MNLTSKRMLQFLAMCVGAVAFTASAQTPNVWVSDSFEDASAGTLAQEYKKVVWGLASGEINQLWKAGTGGDASTIEENEDPYSITSYPIPGAAHGKALKLNTEGDTLSRYVCLTNSAGTMATDVVGLNEQYYPAFLNLRAAGKPVWIDTLMQFTPSEDEPTFSDKSAKFAVWVNGESNLVVRHQYVLSTVDAGFLAGASGQYTNTVFDSPTVGKIIPGQWYRLTMKIQDYDMVFQPEETDPSYLTYWFFAEIFLDGMPLTHSDAWDYDPLTWEYSRGGTLFCAMQDADGPIIKELSFQGTGMVDDLVVTDAIPAFTSPTGVALTLSFGSDIASVMVGSVEKFHNGTVNDGDTLVITAADWYNISSVSSGASGFIYSGTPSGKTSTGTVTALGSGTVTIGATAYTGAWSTGNAGDTGINNVSDFAAWAMAKGISEATIKASGVDAYLDKYLLNVGEGTTPTIKITDIKIDEVAETGTIKVRADTDGKVDFTSIRGRMIVWTSNDLATGWDDYDEVDLLVSYDVPEVTVTLPNVAGKFIRAKIIQKDLVTP